jgi:cytochrome c oxidase assembly protein subunit 15
MRTPQTTRFIIGWLLTCCGMVFIMALIGAITRLTESGLSITEWNPVMGALPPLNAAAWDKAFAEYQQIPQYQILHRDMTLDAFKSIFFWEWLHRVWGRLIGLAFALPLLALAMTRKLDRRLGAQLAIILVLIGLQGFIGWFMVKSGLAVRTSVSPYRLAMHLSFALLIYTAMLRTALDLMALPRVAVPRFIVRFGGFTLGLLAITIVWGALVAGLHAGEAYNSWPLMDGDIVPPAAFTLLPKWLNLFENLALVQFIHRWLGPTTMLAILFWVGSILRMANKDTKTRRWALMLGAMALLQVALGMSTLLSHVNIVLATLHQAGAITLLTLVLINLHRLKKV